MGLTAGARSEEIIGTDSVWVMGSVCATMTGATGETGAGIGEVGAEATTAGTGAEATTAGTGAEATTAGTGAEATTAGTGAEATTASDHRRNRRGSDHRRNRRGSDHRRNRRGSDHRRNRRGSDHRRNRRGSDHRRNRRGSDHRRNRRGSDHRRNRRGSDHRRNRRGSDHRRNRRGSDHRRNRRGSDHRRNRRGSDHRRNRRGSDHRRNRRGSDHRRNGGQIKDSLRFESVRPVLAIDTDPIENTSRRSRFHQLNASAVGLASRTDHRIKGHTERPRQSKPRVIRKRRGHQPFRVRGFRGNPFNGGRIRVVGQHLHLAVKPQARSQVDEGRDIRSGRGIQ